MYSILPSSTLASVVGLSAGAGATSGNASQLAATLADALATYGPTLPQDVWESHLDTVRALLSAFWEQKQEQVAPPALVSGHDLLENFSLSPGPLIGELLEALREAQAMGEVRDRQEALHFAEGWLAKKIT